MSKKIAFLFPGQGSQFIGMGRDIAEHFSEAKEVFDQVDDVCDKSMSRLCFEGPLEELTLTVNLQPAITAVNLACLKALRKSGIRPMVSAGHSLGEYSALAAAESLSDYDTLKLVKKRGELMHRESLSNPGTMAAILGMSVEDVEEIVAKVGDSGVLAIANHNTAEQIVITGEQGPLSKAVEIVKQNGGKAIPLKVSGAWHCLLMEKAVEDFRQFMKDISFSPPQTLILFNATAKSETGPQEIKELMARQLICPVKWYDIILNMVSSGVDTFVEVGPKKVLTGLVKKILPRDTEAKIYNIEDARGLEDFLNAVA
ncbi:MAG: ACP S-malonyltransferase [Deltaproteobacteria bacterium]|nr:ACP S-malonyltransferase [Deltaproteobacteria bacterium]